MKINLVGDILGYTGYASHTRNLANALNEIGLNVRIDCSKPQGWEREVNDAEFNMITNKFDPESTTITIAQPPSWPIFLADKTKKFYGYLVWEGDKIPEYWLDFLLDKRVDGIFVPSCHVRDAILKTAYDGNFEKKIKIHIVPEGFNPSVFYPEEQEKENDNLVFIANKGWSKGIKDRGGIQWLIQAFSEEFTKEDKVELRIKINPVYNDPDWDLKKEMEKLNIDRKDKAPIFTTTDLLDNNTLRGYYNRGDVFVSTSMAEGFNLPVIEAMACGKPALVTYFGGHFDFVNNNNGWIIEKGELVNWSDELIYEDVKWFKPDIKDIREKLRQIYNNQDELKEKGEAALKTASEITWLKSAQKIKSILELS